MNLPRDRPDEPVPPGTVGDQQIRKRGSGELGPAVIGQRRKDVPPDKSLEPIDEVHLDETRIASLLGQDTSRCWPTTARLTRPEPALCSASLASARRTSVRRGAGRPGDLHDPAASASGSYRPSSGEPAQPLVARSFRPLLSSAGSP